MASGTGPEEESPVLDPQEHEEDRSETSTDPFCDLVVKKQSKLIQKELLKKYQYRAKLEVELQAAIETTLRNLDKLLNSWKRFSTFHTDYNNAWTEHLANIQRCREVDAQLPPAPPSSHETSRRPSFVRDVRPSFLQTETMEVSPSASESAPEMERPNTARSLVNPLHRIAVEEHESAVNLGISIAQFNEKPKKGVSFMVEKKLVLPIFEGDTVDESHDRKHPAEEVGEAKRLLDMRALSVALYARMLAMIFHATASVICKNQLGIYLSERGDDVPYITEVRYQYIKMLDLRGMDVISALRRFLVCFKLPGESQKIERLLESFAVVYYNENSASGVYHDADVVLVLAYSLIMLNTDAHNPKVKKRMKKEEFVSNNRAINNGEDLPRLLLEEMYNTITEYEIKMEGDCVMPRSLKRGWLEVTSSSQQWYHKRAKRWVVLCENELHFYKSSTDSIPCQQEFPLGNVEKSVDNRKFRILLHKRDADDPELDIVITLGAESEVSFKDWCLVLDRCLLGESQDCMHLSHILSNYSAPPKPSQSIIDTTHTPWSESGSGSYAEKTPVHASVSTLSPPVVRVDSDTRRGHRRTRSQD